jgi:hypothetical protein
MFLAAAAAQPPKFSTIDHFTAHAAAWLAITMFRIKAPKIGEFAEEMGAVAGQMKEPQEAIARAREQLKDVWPSGKASEQALKDLMILDGCFKTTNDNMTRFSTVLDNLAQDVDRDQGRFNAVALAGEALALAQMFIPFIGKGLAMATSYAVLGVLSAILMKTKKTLNNSAAKLQAENMPQAAQTLATATDVAKNTSAPGVSTSPPAYSTTGGQSLTPSVLNSAPSGGWVAVDPAASSGSATVGGSRIVIETRPDGTVNVEMGQPDHDVSLVADIGGKKVDIKYDGDGDGRVGA